MMRSKDLARTAHHLRVDNFLKMIHKPKEVPLS